MEYLQPILPRLAARGNPSEIGIFINTAHGLLLVRLGNLL
jgi:hypothetical protein